MTTQCAAGSLCNAPEGITLGNHKCCKCKKDVHCVFCAKEVESLPSDIKDKIIGFTALGMNHEVCLKCFKEEKDKLPQSLPATAPPTTEEGGAADADADADDAHIDLSNSDDDDNTAPVTTITADPRPNPSPLTTNTGASRSTSTTTVATLNLRQAPPPSRKPKNHIVRDMYNITTSEAGRIKTVCKGCGETRDVASLNITQLGEHIKYKCRFATDEQKTAVFLASQKGRKARDVLAMTPLTVGGSVATETLSDVRAFARAAHTAAANSGSSSKPPPTKKAKLSVPKVPKQQSKMAVMTKDDMKKIYAPYVHAKVAENNPLSDLLKPYHRAAIIHSHPGIGELLPNTVATIYRDFIKNDEDGDGGAAEKIKKELIEYMLRKPGDINVAHDGVTINGKSKQVYTIARGDVCCFYDFSDLGSMKHNSNAEVDDLVSVSAIAVCFNVEEWK